MKMNKVKHIAIIAFDNKKTELIEWSYFNRKLLMPHKILALGYAANVLEGTLNKKVQTSAAGKFGEYRELCNLINAQEIDAVIIFSGAHEILDNKELRGVFEAATENNIIVAANRTTADFVLNSSLIDAEYIIHKEEKKIADNKPSIKESNFPLAKAS
jgi:methylglyoxal synthase